MRSLKAQLMGMVSGKSEKPCDSTNLPDSATYPKVRIRPRITKQYQYPGLPGPPESESTFHMHVASYIIAATSTRIARHISGRAVLELNEEQHRPYSWTELHRHASNQSARFASGEYPGRSGKGNTQYEVYKRWCKERGVSNEQYVLKYVHWHGGVALEPALAPYLLKQGLAHWVLWHHPDPAAGVMPDAELHQDSEIVTAVTLLGAEGCSLTRDDLVCFQNILQLRSLPTIPHSHVFIRKRTLSNESRRALRAIHNRWRSRSPWLQAAVEQEKGAQANEQRPT